MFAHLAANRTTSSALHRDLTLQLEMVTWEGFSQDAAPPDNLSDIQACYGLISDEMDLQSIMRCAILEKICRKHHWEFGSRGKVDVKHQLHAAGIEQRDDFLDFAKNIEPDVVLQHIQPNALALQYIRPNALVVVEVKVWWIPSHDLAKIEGLSELQLYGTLEAHQSISTRNSFLVRPSRAADAGIPKSFCDCNDRATDGLLSSCERGQRTPP
jgi:hypothetical protein